MVIDEEEKGHEGFILKGGERVWWISRKEWGIDDNQCTEGVIHEVLA